MRRDFYSASVPSLQPPGLTAFVARFPAVRDHTFWSPELPRGICCAVCFSTCQNCLLLSSFSCFSPRVLTCLSFFFCLFFPAGLFLPASIHRQFRMSCSANLRSGHSNCCHFVVPVHVAVALRSHCVMVPSCPVSVLGSDSPHSLFVMWPMSTTLMYSSSRTSCWSESDLPSEPNTWNELLILAYNYEISGHPTRLLVLERRY